MAARQIAFDFGPVRRAPWLVTAPVDLDPELERERTITKLTQRLSMLLGKHITLTFTDNTRTMLSARQREGVTHVRLHEMFAVADENTIDSVGRYLKGGHAAASGHLAHFIESHRDSIRRDVRARAALRATGHYHDLQALLHTLNARYFDDKVDATIGWSRKAKPQRRGRRRRSIKLGSYMARGKEIRVHPVLDAAWVPSFFVQYIVYHEMLHHVIPMPVHKGRRRLHGSEFRARERQFEDYAEAHLWERAHLDRLLSG